MGPTTPGSSDAAVHHGDADAGCGPYAHVGPLLDFIDGLQPLNRQRRPRLLDLCSGTGRLIRAFAGAGWEATGIESSPELTAVARRSEDEDASPTSYVESHWTNADIAGNTFDLTVAFDCATVPPGDGARLVLLLEFAHRHLVDGGYIAFQCGRTQPAASEVTLATMARLGFEPSWRASPLRPGEPIHFEHAGEWDLYLGKRSR